MSKTPPETSEQKARRAQRYKIKDVPAVCIICGADFLTSRSAMAKTCGKSCLSKYKSQLKLERDEKERDEQGSIEVMPCPWLSGELLPTSQDDPDWTSPNMTPFT